MDDCAAMDTLHGRATAVGSLPGNGGICWKTIVPKAIVLFITYSLWIVRRAWRGHRPSQNLKMGGLSSRPRGPHGHCSPHHNTAPA